MNLENEKRILVLQGGGALGAYQAGAYDGLAAAGQEPDWVAGISIGAVNAALIGGNKPDNRVKQLRSFWEKVSSGLQGTSLLPGNQGRTLFHETSSWLATLFGIPGFLPRAFRHRFSPCQQPKPP
jgi:NTE family protein